MIVSPYIHNVHTYVHLALRLRDGRRKYGGGHAETFGSMYAYVEVLKQVALGSPFDTYYDTYSTCATWAPGGHKEHYYSQRYFKPPNSNKGFEVY